MLETSTDKSRAGSKITLVGALVNLFLIAVKFFAGFFGHSQALIADAVHSISDLITDAVVLVGLRLGCKPPDKTHHFGHGRIETLASTMVGLSLVGVALYLGMKAALDIHRHTVLHPTWLALAGAALSIALKEALYHYTIRVGRRIKSTAIVANAWHHRSDALSSVAVLIGVAGAQIRPEWHILDAWAALVVSFFILKVGLEVVWNSVHELTDAAPDTETVDRIKLCAREVEGVIDVHDLKVRTSGGLYQMELHILVDGRLTVAQGHQIAKEVETCLEQEFEDLSEVIVHVDPEME